MTHNTPQITGGVDTHGQTHHAAVIDSVGRHLADQEFPATIRGYRDLLDWIRSHGTLVAVGGASMSFVKFMLPVLRVFILVMRRG
ncbi:transposase [Streptomyces atratus]|uniref:IS110 family transposase n=1 Tax=Streptomyces atratus TaxID=1893 RepID=UPI0036C47DD1